MSGNDRPVPEFGVCSSGKNLYASRALATQAARRYTNKYLWVMDVYQCPECNWFHTSRRKHFGMPVLSLDALVRFRKRNTS